MKITADTTSNLVGVSVHGSTMNVMMQLQALMLQETDLQLRDVAKTMTANLKLKQTYRQQIDLINVAINKIGIADTRNKDGEQTIDSPNKAQLLEMLGLDGSMLRTGDLYSYVFDTEALNGNGEIVIDKVELNLFEEIDPRIDPETGEETPMFRISEKTLLNCQTIIQNKIDDLQSEGEIQQLQLQDLTGKRATSLETLTSLMSKVSDTSSTINRNIGK